MNLPTPARERLLIAGGAGLLTCAVLSLYAFSRLEAHRTYTEGERDRLRAEFIVTAEEADRTATTDASRDVAIDCTERGEFDSLLSRLDTLSAKERTRLDYLFGDCADYFYRLKLYHIARLESLHALYESQVQSASYLYREDMHDARVLELMTEIIERESVRARTMREQIVLQRDVIHDLDRGIALSASTSERIGDIVFRLAEADTAIDTARSELGTQ